MVPSIAWSSFPDAPFTASLIRRALKSVFPDLEPVTTESLPDTNGKPFLQWSTYDLLSHEATLDSPTTVLSSSYTIRKSIIRKHFLHRALHSYVTKHPESYLATHQLAVPNTVDLYLSFADELDEMWSDDLYELGEALDANGDGSKWWILKPSMADRGQGIRLFNSKEALQSIFEGFDEDSDESDESENDVAEEDKSTGPDTNVVTSQLRHFVIQEYLPNPLLLDPSQANIPSNSLRDPDTPLQPTKFHLRAYCIASGALKLYLNPNFLALFAGAPYTLPISPEDSDEELDLTAHLTNTSLQTPTPSNPNPNDNVRLLKEMIGCRVLSHPDGENPSSESLILSQSDIDDITDQVSEVLADTFRAALESPVHFQPLPNAFELFGADLLVSHVAPSSSSQAPKFVVSILELNAEPAIELTGARLAWVLEDMFEGMGQVCVKPFFRENESQKNSEDKEEWAVGETKWGLRKSLEVEVRGERGW